MWTLAKHRSKNKREHRVPLSEPVREILARQKRIIDRDGVFSSSDDGYAAWDRGKKVLHQRLLEARQEAFGDKAAPMPAWVLHDIRRSVATGMCTLVVGPPVIAALLNHVGGIRLILPERCPYDIRSQGGCCRNL